VPHYKRILETVGGGPLRAHFEENMRRAHLGEWVEVHQGRADEIASTWTAPIDLLLLDGDQSPEGARKAYESWAPFLKKGGTIVLRNTMARAYHDGHDGHRRLVVEEIVEPKYADVRLIRATAFARKVSD
jgi:predicted O-methyltransferase YrrM